MARRLDELPRDTPNEWMRPPWEPVNASIHFVAELPAIGAKTVPPEVRAERAVEMMSRLPPADIKVWTDGSAVEATTDGGGAAVVTSRLASCILKMPAGAYSSSFQAEMTAVALALTHCAEIAGPEHGTSVRLCTDSLSCVLALSAGPHNQSCGAGA